MARGPSSTLLSSPEPCTVAQGNVTIGHVQLRDVVICPHEKGIVSYARGHSIVEHDLITPNTSPRRLVELSFMPNTISALILPDTNDTLLAAGGQEAELHLSYYQSSDTSSPSFSRRSCSRGFGRRLWESKYTLDQGSINNSVMLTTMNFARSHESAAEPRIIVSNNDKTVKFFDIALRASQYMEDYAPRLLDIGQLRLDVPVNHSSVSPDGRTLLCVGDSSDVHLHRITGGSRLSFAPIATLSLSAHIQHSHDASGGLSQVSSIPASFSTAFSADGAKFAVASQEGVVVVWDVRSTKPLRVFSTDRARAGVPGPVVPGRIPTGAGSGWMYESPWDWARPGARAPGWGVRSVKFSPPGVGREVMTFTEHTSLLHVVDARTFETEEIVRMPSFDSSSMYLSPTSARPRSTSPTPRLGVMQRSPVDSLTAPRLVLFNHALDDTFRIPASSSSSSSEPGGSGWPRAPRRFRRPPGREDLSADDDAEGSGDAERRLLTLARLRARTAALDAETDPREPLDGGAAEGEEMDVDELESDCVSSRAPSRAGSPAPPPSTSHGPSNGNTTNTAVRTLELLRARPPLLARRESAGPYAGARWGVSAAAASRRRRGAHAHGLGGGPADEEEQDLAGMCFDPTGAFVYVASVKGVAEWRVRGAEQRWWTEPEWA